MSRRLSVAVVGLSVAGLWGCSSEVESQTDEGSWETAQEMEKVAELEIGEGSVLEFYDAFPGVVISGTGPVSSPPPQYDRSLKPIEIFRKFAGERAVPRALLDAQARAEAAELDAPKQRRPGAVPALPSPASPATGEAVGEQSQALWGDNDSLCPWSWFSTERCKNGQTCLGFVDGAKSVQHDDVNYSIGITCNYRNGHNHLSQYRTWWSWTAQGTWFVQPGSWRYAELWSTIDYDFRTTVQVTGGNPGSHIAVRSNESGFRDAPP
jgi:hypothetical protein